MPNASVAGENNAPNLPTSTGGLSTAGYQDCLSCRIIGAATLSGTGAYAIWQSRAVAPGPPWQKRIMAGLGLALIAGGAARWYK